MFTAKRWIPILLWMLVVGFLSFGSTETDTPAQKTVIRVPIMMTYLREESSDTIGDSFFQPVSPGINPTGRELNPTFSEPAIDESLWDTTGNPNVGLPDENLSGEQGWLKKPSSHTPSSETFNSSVFEPSPILINPSGHVSTLPERSMDNSPRETLTTLAPPLNHIFGYGLLEKKSPHKSPLQDAEGFSLAHLPALRHPPESESNQTPFELIISESSSESTATSNVIPPDEITTVGEKPSILTHDTALKEDLETGVENPTNSSTNMLSTDLEFDDLWFTRRDLEFPFITSTPESGFNSAIRPDDSSVTTSEDSPSPNRTFLSSSGIQITGTNISKQHVARTISENAKAASNLTVASKSGNINAWVVEESWDVGGVGVLLSSIGIEVSGWGLLGICILLFGIIPASLLWSCFCIIVSCRKTSMTAKLLNNFEMTML